MNTERRNFHSFCVTYMFINSTALISIILFYRQIFVLQQKIYFMFELILKEIYFFFFVISLRKFSTTAIRLVLFISWMIPKKKQILNFLLFIKKKLKFLTMDKPHHMAVPSKFHEHIFFQFHSYGIYFNAYYSHSLIMTLNSVGDGTVTMCVCVDFAFNSKPKQFVNLVLMTESPFSTTLKCICYSKCRAFVHFSIPFNLFSYI